MFQKAGNRRKESKERTDVMEGKKKDESGRERAGEGGEREEKAAREKTGDNDGEGIGGHLRKQKQRKTKIDRNRGEE